MTYYSPGIKYMCPRCSSNSVRFIFDDKTNDVWGIAEMIHSNSINLSEDIRDYYNNVDAPKWLCYECYDCGIVVF